MSISLNVKEKSENVTIVLNMIVKNESKIILRLLENVHELIDAYCICDTGSTDNTIDIIKKFFSRKRIKGYVMKHAFKDFGYNRNWALDKCRLLFEDMEYILLIDADMILEFRPNFIKNKNKIRDFDYFYIMQGNKDFQYRNIRLIKNDNNIKYIGVTHEYIQLPQNMRSKTFKKEEIFVNDFGDGGCKDDKYERDIKLLSNDIEKDPNNVRSHFYLANSYFDTAQYDDAIKHYKIRIKLAGWKEEIFYSMMRIGIAYMRMKKFEKGISKLMAAYQISPNRAEPLYEIIFHCRLNKKYELANLFYKQAIAIPKPHTDCLFINMDVYNYKLQYEFYIFYYYLNIQDKKHYNSDIIHQTFYKLLSNKAHEQNVLENYKFYTKVFTRDPNFKRIDVTGLKDIYNSSNPSIVKIDNKPVLNIRYVNYYFDKNWNYTYKEEKEKTHNYCVFYNDFNFTEKEKENKITELERKIEDHDVLEGVQDIRLLELKNQIFYTGAVVFDDKKTKKRRASIEFGKYDIKNNKLEGQILISPNRNRDCEKNWVLFTDNKKIYVIYEWSPLTICILRGNTLVPRLYKTVPDFFKRVSGSSNGIIIGNEIWFICHFICYTKPRHYYHMFVTIDHKTFDLKRYSKPFTFEGAPIEYCCGMICHNDTLYITYSVKDKTSKIGIIEKKHIEFYK